MNIRIQPLGNESLHPYFWCAVEIYRQMTQDPKYKIVEFADAFCTINIKRRGE
jgi:hypothetical protein